MAAAGCAEAAMATIDMKDTRLAWREQGSGTPVLALHSTGSNGSQWKTLMSDLSSRHRVIALDLPGYGGSTLCRGTGAATVEAEARAVCGLLDETGAAHLVGHSYGGTVALKIAMLRPKQVKSLAIFEPAVFHLLREGDADDRRLHREIASIEGLLCAAAAVGAPEAGMKHFIDFWNGNGAWSRCAPEVRVRLLSVFGQVIANFAAIDRETWPLARMRQVACPTLALMASRSPALARRITRMIAATIPDCRIRIVADAGHMAPLTHPAIVNGAVASHIAMAERSSSALRAA